MTKKTIILVMRKVTKQRYLNEDNNVPPLHAVIEVVEYSTTSMLI